MVMHEQITWKRTGQARFPLHITKRFNTSKIKQIVSIRKNQRKIIDHAVSYKQSANLCTNVRLRLLKCLSEPSHFHLRAMFMSQIILPSLLIALTREQKRGRLQVGQSHSKVTTEHFACNPIRVRVAVRVHVGRKCGNVEMRPGSNLIPICDEPNN